MTPPAAQWRSPDGNRWRHLPNQLTIARLAITLPLWGLALFHLRTLLGVGLLLAGLTDVLDGRLARSLGRTSRRGSQLDSLADLVLFISIVIWLRLLRPEFFAQYAMPILLWAGFGIATLAFGWFRFRRFLNLHLYSAKAAGVIGYVFTVYMLMFDGPAAPFFWIAITAAFIGAAETLLVMATRSQVDETTGTILRQPGRRG